MKSFDVSMLFWMNKFPDSKVHGAKMGPSWGRQNPGGPHVGPIYFACFGLLNKPTEDTHVTSL